MAMIWKESSGKTQNNGTIVCRGMCCYPARPCCSSLSESLLVPFHTTNSAWIPSLPSLCFCLLPLSLISCPIFPLEHIHTSIPISPPLLFSLVPFHPVFYPSFPASQRSFSLPFLKHFFFLLYSLRRLWFFLFFFHCSESGWLSANAYEY